MSIGLIGFGRLGRLLVRHFRAEHEFHVYDARPQPREVRALGATPASLAQACSQSVVLLCVPIGQFEGVVRRISALLRPDALVLDVCSVKEYPVRVMKRFLPKSVEILATHPNFGPDSAADTLAGRQITLCPVRISSRRLGEVLRALQKKKLKVVRLSPGDHDRRMAASLLLTHFIGRSLIDFGAKTTGMDTEGYQRLLRILQTVQNDSWQLFEDMNHYNRHAARMRARLIKSISRVDARVNR